MLFLLIPYFADGESGGNATNTNTALLKKINSENASGKSMRLDMNRQRKIGRPVKPKFFPALSKGAGEQLLEQVVMLSLGFTDAQIPKSAQCQGGQEGPIPHSQFHHFPAVGP